MPSPVLLERYGAPSRWRRTLLVAATAALAVVCLAWLAWVVLFHASPQASSELVGFEVTGEHEAVAFVQVSLEDDADATCRVRAASEDHLSVGELAFTPAQGRNEVTIRTERRATAVELVGCTTPDQPRPR
jgi:hypothetical protein